MPAPTFNTPDGPPQCPHCGGSIRYQERRRVNGVWVHGRCAMLGSRQHLIQVLQELDIPEGDQSFNNGLAVLACMNVEGGDFGKAAELSGLRREFVEEAIRPLVEQGVFRDGVWYYDGGDADLDNPQHCAIQILMWILCSMRMLERRPGRSG